MRRNIFILSMLLIACVTLAKTNYQELLVRGQRTYWANIGYLIQPRHDYSDVTGVKQAGMYFDIDGNYAYYKITVENDTSAWMIPSDLMYNVAYQTYELSEDTVFITTWYDDGEPPYLKSEAYKILYLTKEKMVMLSLTTDSFGGWKGQVYPTGQLVLREYRCLKPNGEETP